MRSLVNITAGALLLAGCSTQPAAVKTDIAAIELALTAAEKAALLYVTRPQCPKAAPLCSDKATVDQIKQADSTAYAAVKAARASGGSASAATASAAIAALVSMIPAGQ